MDNDVEVTVESTAVGLVRLTVDAFKGIFIYIHPDRVECIEPIYSKADDRDIEWFRITMMCGNKYSVEYDNVDDLLNALNG